MVAESTNAARGAGGVNLAAEGGKWTRVEDVGDEWSRVTMPHQPENLKKVSTCKLAIRWQRVAEEPLRALANRVKE